MMLFHAGWENEGKTKILCGGEALPESLKQHFVKTKSEAWNLYGPTETTIWSTLAPVEEEKSIHIGKPIANTQIYILDGYRQPTPIGVPGSLCIAGKGLAKGYFNQPDLTAEKFIDNPFNSDGHRMSDGREPHRSVALQNRRKLYQTGDLARWRPDGNI